MPVYFVDRPDKKSFEDCPQSKFIDSFRRHDVSVLHLFLDNATRARLHESVAPGDVVYLYNLGWRSRTDLANKIIVAGGVPINLPKYFGKKDTWEQFNLCGLPVPRQVFVPVHSRLLDYVKDLSFPIITKVINGHGGKGISIFMRPDQIDDQKTRHGMVAQEYLSAGINGIVRLNVVGDEVIGSMRVRPTQGAMVTNLTINGLPEPYAATAEEETLAVEGAKAIGLDISGVDMIQCDEGPVLLECNAVPGFRGTKDAGIDNFHHNIVDFIVKTHNSRS